ncbi:lipopolysaccharide biosynthesis protein [Thermus scotoductus]
MKGLLRASWLKGSFARGVLAIGGGTALAQLVAVLFSPILSRLYTPEQLGIWGLFVSFVGLASVATSLRYEVAIVAARNDEDAMELTHSSLFLVLIISFLGALVFEWLRRENALGYGVFPPLATFVAFFALISTGSALVLRYFALRREAFAVVGRFTVLQGWSKVLLQVILAPFGHLGLILGETLGRFVGLRWLFQGISCRGLRFNLRIVLSYWTYPVIQLPSSFLNTLALMAPVPIFAYAYGVAAGGALALALRVVGIPVGLIGNAVGDVFYGRASSVLRSEPRKLPSLFVGTSLRLGLVGLTLGALMWFLAPRVTPWLFGPEWSLAGQMLGVMAPWMAFQLAVSPVSRVVFLSSRSWLKLLYDFTSLGMISSPIWLLNEYGPVQALLGVSLLMAGAYVIYFTVLFVLVTRLRYEIREGA